MELSHQFLRLIYPFRHPFETDRGKRHLSNLDAHWDFWWARLPGEHFRKAINDTYFFLPHVRQLLFPETHMLGEGEVRDLANRARGHNEAGLPVGKAAELLPDDAVLHLTRRPANLEPVRRLTIDTGDAGSSGWTYRLGWVDLLLFPQRVGFLLLHLEPEAPAVPAQQWARLLQAASVVHPPVLEWEPPSWSSKAGTFRAADLVDYLLAGCIDEAAPPSDHVFEGRPWDSESRYTRSPAAVIHGAAFHVYSFSCLAVDDLEQATRPRAPFDSVTEAILFELATGLDPFTDEGRPHPKRLRDFRQNDHIGLWMNWEAAAFGNRALFLGGHEGEFTTRHLRNNVASEYQYLYLLTLFQKLRLSWLNGELLRRDQGFAKQHRESHRLWSEFMSFQHLYWYTEVTPRPQGRLLYDRFQSSLDLPRLYRQVNTELESLHRHYEGRVARSANRLLNVLTYIGVPASLWVGLFGSALVAEVSDPLSPSWGLALGTGLLFYLVVLVLWLWNWNTNR